MPRYPAHDTVFTGGRIALDYGTSEGARKRHQGGGGGEEQHGSSMERGQHLGKQSDHFEAFSHHWNNRKGGNEEGHMSAASAHSLALQAHNAAFETGKPEDKSAAEAASQNAWRQSKKVGVEPGHIKGIINKP